MRLFFKDTLKRFKIKILLFLVVNKSVAFFERLKPYPPPPMEERLLIIAFLCVSGEYGLGEIFPHDEEIREVDAQVKYFGFNPNMN